MRFRGQPGDGRIVTHPAGAFPIRIRPLLPQPQCGPGGQYLDGPLLLRRGLPLADGEHGQRADRPARGDQRNGQQSAAVRERGGG